MEHTQRTAAHEGVLVSDVNEPAVGRMHLPSPVEGVALCEWAGGFSVLEGAVLIAEPSNDPRVVARHVSACKDCCEVRFS